MASNFSARFRDGSQPQDSLKQGMGESFHEKAQVDLLAGLLTRRSVRKFLPKPVSLDTVRELIKYGTHAPTACNFQAWRFVVVTDEQIRESLINAGGGQVIRSSPVGILVFYDNRTRNVLYRDDIQSASACIQNILVAAHAMGLGACWICSLPAPAYIRRLLNVPGSFSPVAYVAIGYPAAQPKEVLRRRALDNLLGINRFPNEGLEKGTNVFALWLERFMILVYLKLPAAVKKRFLNRIVDKLFTKKFEN